MWVHTTQAALHCQRPSCWRKSDSLVLSKLSNSALVQGLRQLRAEYLESFGSRSNRSARTSPALPSGTDFQVQSPDVIQDSGAPPDIFQSALNALDLVSPTESYDPDFDEHHEDISIEQGQAAAQVGKAVYEVRCSTGQVCTVLVVHCCLRQNTSAQVLKLSSTGKTRRIYVKRRDLLRANHLQPRDLRRIDPSLSITKTSPNISVKENCLLINLGGVR